VGKTMTHQHFGGAKDHFQTKKKFAGMFFNFFLPGQRSKLTQITGTKIIFKSKTKKKK